MAVDTLHSDDLSGIFGALASVGMKAADNGASPYTMVEGEC